MQKFHQEAPDKEYILRITAELDGLCLQEKLHDKIKETIFWRMVSALLGLGLLIVTYLAIY